MRYSKSGLEINKSVPVSVVLFFGLFLMFAVWNETSLAEENQQDETNKNNYYSVVDELACGDGKAIAVTVSTKGTEYPQLLDQTIYIKPKKGPEILVRESSDWSILYNRGKQYNNILENRISEGGLPAEWNCIKGNSSREYVVVSYSSGGNCPSCVWNEIYDLDGKVVASTYLSKFKLSQEKDSYEFVPNKEGRKAMAEFNYIIGALGINYDLQSLKPIKYKN